MLFYLLSKSLDLGWKNDGSETSNTTRTPTDGGLHGELHVRQCHSEARCKPYSGKCARRSNKVWRCGPARMDSHGFDLSESGRSPHRELEADIYMHEVLDFQSSPKV